MKYKDTPIYIWCLFEDIIEFITTGDKTNGFTWEKDFGYAKADEYLNFVIHFKEIKKLKEMGTDFE